MVITMVTNADAVRSIANEQGLVEALRAGAAWAQMSTIGVAATEEVAALVATRRPDVLFVDAPVSGSKVPAENWRWRTGWGSRYPPSSRPSTGDH
jgi:3-hydroxyisobutyrate dehydrogenase